MKQPNMIANSEQNQSKKYFSYFLVAIKSVGCVEFSFFGNVFQFDGVSKVENITLWMFYHVFKID